LEEMKTRLNAINPRLPLSANDLQGRARMRSSILSTLLAFLDNIDQQPSSSLSPVKALQQGMVAFRKVWAVYPRNELAGAELPKLFKAWDWLHQNISLDTNAIKNPHLWALFTNHDTVDPKYAMQRELASMMIEPSMPGFLTYLHEVHVLGQIMQRLITLQGRAQNIWYQVTPKPNPLAHPSPRQAPMSVALRLFKFQRSVCGDDCYIAGTENHSFLASLLAKLILLNNCTYSSLPSVAPEIWADMRQVDNNIDALKRGAPEGIPKEADEKASVSVRIWLPYVSVLSSCLLRCPTLYCSWFTVLIGFSESSNRRV
jgi:hypothetical protein